MGSAVTTRLTPPMHTLDYPDLEPHLLDHPALQVYQKVKVTALPNYKCARIPLKSDLNIMNWKAYVAHDPQHKDLIDYLQFGFPLNYESSQPPTTEAINHMSARNYPDHIDRHISIELQHDAIVGPFETPPFTQWTHTNPLITREKRGSESHRVITDMSWPLGHSVNAAIPKDSYQGQPAKTTLPTLDYILQKVRQYGSNTYMSSIDISRAYAQLRVDPLDWPLQSILWKGQYYVATALQFGYRWGPTRVKLPRMQCVKS